MRRFRSLAVLVLPLTLAACGATPLLPHTMALFAGAGAVQMISATTQRSCDAIVNEARQNPRQPVQVTAEEASSCASRLGGYNLRIR